MAIFVENIKFSHPRVFCASTEGIPLVIGTRTGGASKN